MTGVTEGCRVVLEDLLGQGKTEGSPVSWAGLVQEVQVLVRGGLEGLGQSQSQVRVLAMEQPGGLILYSLVEQQAGGGRRAGAWQGTRQGQLG